MNIQMGLDSARVAAIVGKPDSISSISDFRDEDAVLITWHYSGFEVLLGSYNSVGGVTISGSGLRTSRALAVGDSISRVRELYGTPLNDYQGNLSFGDSRDEEHSTVLSILTKDSIVTRIYLGHIYD
ncbi:MAG: hypothetical protein KF749_14670 [Bacteroidetes bacterium]|nr:hypothetical protein [Bacteroidota bacterium]MCW5894294.1 hypothetical protein [Bacteroidota bacterium]